VYFADSVQENLPLDLYSAHAVSDTLPVRLKEFYRLTPLFHTWSVGEIHIAKQGERCYNYHA